MLGDLPHVQQRAEYQRANAGFSFDYQVVNVDDFNGVGESEPNPYFFQVRWMGGGWTVWGRRGRGRETGRGG